MEAIRLPEIATSATVSRFNEGSITRPPRTIKSKDCAMKLLGLKNNAAPAIF